MRRLKMCTTGDVTVTIGAAGIFQCLHDYEATCIIYKPWLLIYFDILNSISYYHYYLLFIIYALCLYLKIEIERYENSSSHRRIEIRL
jgi:hypothetical protein